jgi:DNA-binding FadR family transcriptional regulator
VGPLELRAALEMAMARLGLERERERLITELQQALAQVKLLSGLLPICANCKKIRDDKGYWKQVETFISEHSEAIFSHGICPECVRKHYPDLADDVLPED